MRILVWCPPWVGQGGDPHFFANALNNHLLPQARRLAEVGCAVDVVAGDLLLNADSSLHRGIRPVPVSLRQVSQWVGQLGDPSRDLYRGDVGLSERIAKGLAGLGLHEPDVVLLWETPVPFLRALFPRASFLHQMPGPFSRTPYGPAMSVDPQGLYRDGSLAAAWHELRARGLSSPEIECLQAYRRHIRSGMRPLLPFRRSDLDPGGRFRRLFLLPLQVSDHYAFSADTPYRSQAEFLLDVLDRAPVDVGIVVTQYIARFVQDRALTPELVDALRSRYRNFIYRPEFDRIAGASQYLLPQVDGVVSCSSSLALQALSIWQLPVVVEHATYLSPFAQASDVANLGEVVASDEDGDALLALILSRAQVPREILLGRPKQLLSYVESLRAQSTAASALERFPNLLELIPRHANTLSARTAFDRAARELSDSGASEIGQEVAEIRAALRSPRVQAISIDLFDTLVNRPLAVPADVYLLLEQRVVRNGLCRITDFADARLRAELAAREDNPTGEITLGDIYQRLAVESGLDDATLRALMDAECEIELELAEARPIGRRLWELAQETRKPIFITSDMYLPRATLERMVHAAGFEGPWTLILSSEHNCRKHDGGLYDVLVRRAGVEAGAILHLGDTPLNDVERAADRGLQALLVKRAVHALAGHPLYRRVLAPLPSHRQSIGRSVVTALTAHELFDLSSRAPAADEHFGGDPYRLGYAGFGPVVAAFALWLGRTARAEGRDQLWFLSREGAILLRAYECLFDGLDLGAPPGRYLYASRRALRVASIRSESDAMAVMTHRYTADAMTAAEFMHARFGILRSELSESDRAADDCAKPDELISNTHSGRVRLNNLVRVLAPRILERARDEREAYLAYLSEMGVNSGAVVDIGWSANMQGALSRLLGVRLAGYYYATLGAAQRWQAHGFELGAFAGDLLPSDLGASVLVDRRPLVEFTLCGVDASLEHFEVVEGRPVPRFLSLPGQHERAQLISTVHDGIVAFCRDLRRRLGRDLGLIHIDRHTAEAVLGQFLRHPAATDAELYRGQAQEDRFGGLSRRYLIPPKVSSQRDLRDVYWQEGAAAIAAAADATTAPGQPPLSSLALRQLSRPLREPLVRRVEGQLLARMTSEQKLAKYHRNRARFFADSRSALGRWWGSLTEGK